MRPETEYKYMRYAMGLAGVAVTTEMAELIVRMHKGIQEKKGEFSLQDAAEIETYVSQKWDKKLKRKKKK